MNIFFIISRYSFYYYILYNYFWQLYFLFTYYQPICTTFILYNKSVVEKNDQMVKYALRCSNWNLFFKLNHRLL